MNTNAPVAPIGSSRWQSRAAGIAVLGTFAGAVVWAVVQAVLAWRDGWVAPLHLSPDQEQVVQLRQKLAHEEFELARVQAEVDRTTAEAEAVDAALARLGSLREAAKGVVAWQAGVQGDEARTAGLALSNLKRQREALERLRARVRTLDAQTQRDLAAGLVTRAAAERERRSLDEVEAALLENALLTDEAGARHHTAVMSAAALRAADSSTGLHPERAAAVERQARLELEIARLEAEKRGLAATRRAAVDGVTKARALLDELRGRPLYRALEAPTDVVFVPYTQAGAVVPGSDVIACHAGVFACRRVGTVRALVEGEVVTQDPWGDPARGRYALVDLTESEAVQEKVLRVRSPGSRASPPAPPAPPARGRGES